MISWTKTVTLVTFLILVAVFAFINYRIFAPYLLAMAMGGVIALLIYPLYRRFRRRFSPRWASLLASLVLILCILLPLGAFSTVAVDQGIFFGERVVASAPKLKLQGYWSEAMRWEPLQMVFGSPAAVQEQLREGLQKLGHTVTDWILVFAGAFPSLLMELLLAVITCFFLLSDGPAFLAWIRDKIPMEDEVRERLYFSLKSTSVSVIWAGACAATAQAFVLFAGYLVLGVPAAFLAGGVAFIAAWVPIIGSSPVWLAAAIYLYAKASFGRMIVMLGIGLSIGVMDNVVRSVILGGKGGMHPLVSLVAIIGGVKVFGIAGVFLGPISAAILIALLQIWPAVGDRFGLTERKEMGPQSLSA